MKKISIIAAVALAMFATGAAASADNLAPTPGEVFVDGPTTGLYRAGTGPTKVAAVELSGAGSYILHADLQFSQHEGAPKLYGARCDFQLPNERLVWFGQQSTTVGPEQGGVLSFQRAVTTTVPGPVNLMCYGWWDTSIYFNHTTLTVQAVPKITQF